MALTSTLEQYNQDLLHVYHHNIAGLQQENLHLRQALESLMKDTSNLLRHVTGMDQIMQLGTFVTLQQQGLPRRFNLSELPTMGEVPQPKKTKHHSDDDEVYTKRARKLNTTSPEGSSGHSSPHNAWAHQTHPVPAVRIPGPLSAGLMETTLHSPGLQTPFGDPIRNVTPASQIVRQFPQQISLVDPMDDQQAPKVVFQAIAQKLLDQHGITHDDERHMEAALSLAGAADRDVYLPANHPSPVFANPKTVVPTVPPEMDTQTPSAFINFAPTPAADEYGMYTSPQAIPTPVASVPTPKPDDFALYAFASPPPNHETMEPVLELPETNASPNHASPSAMTPASTMTPGNTEYSPGASTPADTTGLPPRLARCVDSLPCKEMRTQILLLKQLGIVDVDALCEALRRQARCNGNPRELASWSVPKDFFVQFPDLRIEGLRERSK